jgi:hypothetical protein
LNVAISLIELAFFGFFGALRRHRNTTFAACFRLGNQKSRADTILCDEA